MGGLLLHYKITIIRAFTGRKLLGRIGYYTGGWSFVRRAYEKPEVAPKCVLIYNRYVLNKISYDTPEELIGSGVGVIFYVAPIPFKSRYHCIITIKQL